MTRYSLFLSKLQEQGIEPCPAKYQRWINSGKLAFLVLHGAWPVPWEDETRSPDLRSMITPDRSFDEVQNLFTEFLKLHPLED